MSTSGWQTIRLGELVEIKHGFAFKGEFFRDSPPGDILLTPGNFAIGGGFKSDKLKYYNGPVPEEYVLLEGDLLVTMTDLSKSADTLGYPALVPKPLYARFLHNQRLGLRSLLGCDRSVAA
jgi:type I restriction enzyme, S subunit